MESHPRMRLRLRHPKMKRWTQLKSKLETAKLMKEIRHLLKKEISHLPKKKELEKWSKALLPKK